MRWINHVSSFCIVWLVQGLFLISRSLVLWWRIHVWSKHQHLLKLVKCILRFEWIYILLLSKTDVRLIVISQGREDEIFLWSSCLTNNFGMQGSFLLVEVHQVRSFSWCFVWWDWIFTMKRSFDSFCLIQSLCNLCWRRRGLRSLLLLDIWYSSYLLRQRFC